MTDGKTTAGATVARICFALLIGGIAYFAAKPYGAAAPLGVPLPDVPQLITWEGVEFEDTSISDYIMNERLLELMGHQSDGNPPLLRSWEAAGQSFTIGQPYRSEMLEHSIEEFLDNGVLAEVVLPYNQTLQAIKYSFPVLAAGETHAIYVSKIRQQLEDGGVEFIAPQGCLELENYRFETIEYIRTDDSGSKQVHFLCIGPFGERALVIDFMTVPKFVDSGRRYAHKIASSFVPGKQLIELLKQGSQASDQDQPVESAVPSGRQE